ncbi:MAG: O-antigen ligase family protein [Gemmatimonadales bacterium]
MIARALLVTFAVVVLLFPQGTITRSGTAEALVAGFLAVTALVALLERSFAPAPQRRWQPLGLLHPMLLALVVYLLALNPYLSWLQGNDPGLITRTTVPFVILCAYYLLVLARIAEREVAWFLDATLVGTVLLCASIWWVSLSQGAGLERVTVIEAGGQRTLIYPLLAIGGTVAFTRLLGDQRWPRRLAAGVVFLFALSAILLTVTRAMLAALLIGCLASLGALALVRRGRQLVGVLASAVAATVVGLALVPPFLTRWEARLSSENLEGISTLVGRVEEFRAFWTEFRQSPLTGQGLGHQFGDPTSSDIGLATVGLTLPHNHLAFVAGTLGVVGLVLYYGVLVGALGRGARLLHRWRREPQVYTLILAILAGLGAGLTFTMASTTYTALSYNYFVAFAVYALRLRWTSPVVSA